MRRVTREITYNTMDKNNTPAAIIQPGEIVQIETKQNNGDWLRSVEDRWDPSKSNGPNLCTVVAVEGACPGDTLAVEILDVVPEKLG
ncbi:MAG: acetamidase/formamidase family protein, partial [Lachnospiraceae bacterium]|nr:acetamidase/formamidase family protein [Lachnospiraceae bacterium]